MISQGDIWWAVLPEPVVSGPGFERPNLVAWKLKVSRDSDRLVAPVPEQACDSFGLHNILPAAWAAYAEA